MKRSSCSDAWCSSRRNRRSVAALAVALLLTAPNIGRSADESVDFALACFGASTVLSDLNRNDGDRDAALRFAMIASTWRKVADGLGADLTRRDDAESRFAAQAFTTGRDGLARIVESCQRRLR